MTASRELPEELRGYGNIYTPHAGAMIIQVQRESGLANRTIILTQRQVRWLKRALYTTGVLLAVGTASWLVLAAQASRVPILQRKVATLQRDVKRVDTLQLALVELDRRFQQVQTMLGASGAAPTGASAALTASPPPQVPPALPTLSSVTATPTVPSVWPLEIDGQVLPREAGDGGGDGLNIAVPKGTAVRAAGGGTIVEVKDELTGGKTIRIAHPDGYETVYGNTSEAKVEPGQRVPSGAVIASSGDVGKLTISHLHFELWRNGAAVDPMSILNQRGEH
ncbi:MAG: M23 family metallopeptidase [Gemmatimonadaceae bacterium]